MAGIDKTYLKHWKDYEEVKSWCESCGKVTDDFGNSFRPIDFLLEWNKEDWKEEEGRDYPIWNTPTYFDVWLIRNCPLEVIQNRLKEQYGGGWSKAAFTDHNYDNLYNQIKNRISVYDTYRRNGLGKKAKISIERKINYRFRDTGMYWMVDCLDNSWWIYDDEYWKNKNDLRNAECKKWMSSSVDFCGYMSDKKILRLIRKWNLPEGLKFKFTGIFDDNIVKEYIITVKK